MINVSNFYSSILIALSILTTACGKVEKKIPIASIIGNWKSECDVNNQDENKPSRVGIKINESTIEQVSYTYSDVNCSKLFSTLGYTNSYTKSSDTINTTISSSNKTSYHEQITIDELNLVEDCEFKDWQLGVAKELINTDCYEPLEAKKIPYTLNGNVLIIKNYLDKEIKLNRE